MRLLVLCVLAGCSADNAGDPFDIEGDYSLTWSCTGDACDQTPWFALLERATFEVDTSTWMPDCVPLCSPPTAPIFRHEDGCVTVHRLNTGTGLQIDDFDLCPEGGGFSGDVADGWSVVGSQ